MLIRVPDYYDRFSCWAGACPHSCCIGWEVVLDEETVRRYETADGPMGERVRNAMQTDEDGDRCFALQGGRCPLLNQENLCDIYCAWGEAATSQTCREHPRFTEDYGSFREITLSASCPAVNALLLGSEEPLGFCTVETDEKTEEGDCWLEWLEPLRDRMLFLLQDRRVPLHRRLRQVLLLAEQAQPLIDEEKTDLLIALAQSGDEPEEVQASGTMFPQALELLQDLEILEPGWDNLLEEAKTGKQTSVSEPLLERIAVYFAFRYLLKTVNDGDLVSRARFVVFSTLVVERLAAFCSLSEALRRYSREIEHNEDNVDALLEELSFDWWEPLLGELH